MHDIELIFDDFLNDGCYILIIFDLEPLLGFFRFAHVQDDNLLDPLVPDSLLILMFG